MKNLLLSTTLWLVASNLVFAKAKIENTLLPIIITTIEVKPTCPNYENGKIKVASLSNGTAPYTYLWSTGETTDSLTHLQEGLYNLTVTDALGNTGTSSTWLVQATFSAQVAIVQPITCPNSDNGILVAKPKNGTPPYNYIWNTGEATDTISNLRFDWYNVTISDAKNCKTNTFKDLSYQHPQAEGIALQRTASCRGNSATGKAKVSLFNSKAVPFSYLWDNGQTSDTATHLSSGLHYFTVTDALGCSASNSVNILTDSINFQVNTLQHTYCPNQDEGKIAVVFNNRYAAPYNILWSNGAITDTISNLTSGYYTVTVTGANGCTDKGEAYVSYNYPYAHAQVKPLEYVSCINNNGKAAVTAVFNLSPPYTYLWSNGSTTSTATNLTVAYHKVTVTDRYGCSTSNTVYIGKNTPLIELKVVRYPSCPTYHNGILSVNAVYHGVPPYSYLWANGVTTSSVGSASEAYYTVTVTDARGCSTRKDFLLEKDLKIAIKLIKYPKCNATDGKLYVEHFKNPGTIYNYKWSNGATTDTITNLSEDLYRVTVSYGTTCKAEDYFYLEKPSHYLQLKILQDATCPNYNNGKLAIDYFSSGVKPYTYLWSNGATTDSITNLSPWINYTLTVTDANGCSASSDASLLPKTLSVQTASVKNPTNCPAFNDGTIDLLVENGIAPFSYSWSNGATTPNALNLTEGSYYVTVTDAMGCTATTSTGLYQQFPSTNIDILSPATCFGSLDGKMTIVVYSTIPTSYTYLWDNGETTDTAIHLKEGLHYVTITGQNGCSFTSSRYLYSSIQHSASLTVVKKAYCPAYNNGVATLHSCSSNARPYTYLWDNGTTRDTAKHLISGYHQLTITDTLGCAIVASTSVNQEEIILNLNITQIPSCPVYQNGIVNVTTTSSSPAPFSFVWSNGAQSSSATNLALGTHHVTATNALGCVATNSVTLTTQVLKVNLSIVKALTCPSYNNATATVISVQNGLGYYDYKWSNNKITRSIANISSGTYAITLTDKTNGCIATSSIVVDSLKPVLTTNIIDPTCPTSTNGSISVVSLSNFAGTATYNWSNGATTNSISNLGNGNYDLSITGSTGCVATKTFSLISKGINGINILGKNNLYCPNQLVTLTAQNLNNVLWSSGNVGNSATYNTGLQNTKVWVKGTSTQGCIFKDTFELKVVPPLVANFNYTVQGNTIHFQNKTNLLSYLYWDFGDGYTAQYLANPIHNYTSNGKYTVQLIAIDQCGQYSVHFDTITIKAPLLLSAKVYLEGAFLQTTGAMSDDLRSFNLIPLTEPYSSIPNFQHVNGGGGEIISSTLLNNTQSPTIVDWIFMELRNPQLPTQVLATRAALLLQDGNIVDVDGTSPVKFPNMSQGPYYVTIRHRNHLGFSTLDTIPLSQNVTILDFTANLIPLKGANPTTALGVSTLQGLHVGDAISDGSIDATDISIWEAQNGYFDNYNHNADFNLDGSVDSLDSALWEINNGKYEELD